MASSVLREISKDEHERAKLRSRRLFEMDMTSNLLTAEGRGYKKGKKEGRKELKPVIEEQKAVISVQKAALTEKDAALAEKEATIAELRAQLSKYQ